ncbi:hypothetical protein L7F22_031514 [Adiantum nelumboides]|nr:hypothetical protein [Adiantum nelumboides]
MGAASKRKTAEGKQLKAKDVQATNNIEQILNSQIGDHDFENLRISIDYKNKLKCNIFAIIRQLGHPTFFVTFSRAEQRWDPLQACLKKLNPQNKEADYPNNATFVRVLVQADPLTTTRYYVHRFKSMKLEIKRDNAILGKVMDYFFVTEFQHSGSQHDHGLIWIKDAPCFGVASNDDVITFVDKYIPMNKDSLHETLRLAQTHSHRKACKKRKTECRFGFPHAPSRETVILLPVVMSEEKKRALLANKARIDEKLTELGHSPDMTFDKWIDYLSMDERTYIE